MSKYIIQKAIDRKDMSAKALKAMDGKRYGLQPKWDGCHLVVKFHSKGFGCESATGEEVRSCGHIGDALVDSAGSFDLDGYAITGEVWKENTPFPDISGSFRRHAAQPDLKFVVLDIVKLDQHGELNDSRGWEERIRTVALKEHPSLIWVGLRDPRIIPPVKYAEDLKAAGGYDGAILRDVNAPYKVGRCRDGEVIKVKPLLSLDLMCVGHVADIGEKTGRPTVALLVTLGGGKIGKVATGLTHAQQANPGQFSGYIIEVEAMGWTEDGLLREPRFKGVRHDKVAADR